MLNEEKWRWPELVGMDGEQAAKKIQQENLSLYVILMPRGEIRASTDFVPDQVRVFVDHCGKVNLIPRIR